LQSPEQLAKSRNHVRRWLDPVRRPYQQVHGAQLFLLQAECFANAALYAIALDCPCGVLFRHQNAQPWKSRIASLEEKAVAGQIASRPLAQQAFELRFLPQPASRIETETLAARGYSPRRRRPLARRLRSTARPPRVPLRTRKPWRRARRVLEGW
jgi:hypothetical protein